MKYVITLFLITIYFSSNGFTQFINGRISSSIYSFERFENTTTSDKFVRGYQSLILNISKEQFSLKTNLIFENEFSKEIINNNRFRAYNLYFEARNLFNIVSLKIGRQSAYNNVIGGLFDGINLNASYKMFKFSGFWGANVPPYQQLKLIENIGDNYIIGGKLSANLFSNFNLSAGYYNKNYLTSSYSALRMDDNFNPLEYLIQLKSNQFKFGSIEADYLFPGKFAGNLRFDYDFNLKKPSKLEAFARYNPIEKFGVELYYNFREPLIRYNSIFAVFDFANTHEIEVGTDYQLNPGLSFNGRFGYVKYTDENSSRITLGATTKYGNISYRKSLGYAGELDAVTLYSAHSFLDGILTPSLGLTYTSYKLNKSDNKNDLISLLAGINVRYWRNLSLDIQGQYLSNKIYKNDTRFFLRLNYWFNTNLKLI